MSIINSFFYENNDIMKITSVSEMKCQSHDRNTLFQYYQRMVNTV